MLPKYPKIAVVYLSFHSELYLDDVVTALKKMTYPKEQVEFIIVDNPHPEYGPSTRYIEENIMPLSGTELPHITLLPQATNLGFSGGNNKGIVHAMAMGCTYIYLHNNDGFTSPDTLTTLVAAMEANSSIGVAQSLMLLYPETDRINSSGNSLQYLGIGYCNNFRELRSTLRQAPVAQTNYASGAAVLLRADLLQKFGLWDEDYFLYHEDIEYCVRLRLAGYTIVTVQNSLFYHKYNFSRNKEKFYYIERNRLGLLLSMYQVPTLLLLLPIGILWELGMLYFAFKNKWLRVKLDTYRYWLRPSTWGLWFKKRNRLQKMRTISDRELLKATVNTVQFTERSINTPLVRLVANPLLAGYGTLVRAIIFW